ncbi:MAG TPA: stability determinant [Allosphingosinicella sp.]|nr:stability determinant [Allosphingosinicella sp.]
MTDPSPVGSGLDTAEEAEAYLRWLKAKVAESFADHRPSIDHDEAIKRVRAIIGLPI